MQTYNSFAYVKYFIISYIFFYIYISIAHFKNKRMPLPARKKKCMWHSHLDLHCHLEIGWHIGMWSVAPPLAEAQNMGVSIVKPWSPSPRSSVRFYCRVMCLWIAWLEAQTSGQHTRLAVQIDSLYCVMYCTLKHNPSLLPLPVCSLTSVPTQLLFFIPLLAACLSSAHPSMMWCASANSVWWHH